MGAFRVFAGLRLKPSWQKNLNKKI